MSTAEHETDANDANDPAEDIPAEVPAVVRRWQGQLLDLSMRNPLISLGDAGVPLYVDEDGLAAVESVVAQGVPVTVRGVEDLDELEVEDSAHGVHDLDPDTLLAALDDGGLVFARIATRQLRTVLSDLRRRAQLVREEMGATALYLTVGGLRIAEDSATGARALAPLLLLPITLAGPRLGPHVIQLEPGAAVRVNECLLEWLRRTAGFEPEALRDPPLSDTGVDVPKLLDDLRDALGEAGLAHEVVPDARIALLRYSTMPMWRDVHEHWQTLCANPLVDHLARRGGPDFSDPVAEPPFTDTTEADLTLPLPADGSQLQAVAWAAAGRTFVLEGPPGTGKSQTITNVIADALNSGKRVLFVAEKQAALDVVARRLRQVGLDGACLDLHGKDRTSRDVRARLRAACERLPQPAGGPHGFDGLVTRRRVLVERLAEYPRQLREAAETVMLDAGDRRDAVREYGSANARLRQALRTAIAEKVAQRIDTGEATDTVDGVDAVDVLRREVRTAHESGMTEFIATHVDAILRVTPCLLMSPSTVAQYLPAQPGLFDLVIFDESSQIRVSAAVGALGRARAAVIVGDARQMPPSESFTVSGGADDDGGEGEQESILLEAHRVGLPSLRLDRHYRSRTEGLVSFSNRRYYDGGLATFPTPPGSHADAGVEIRRVAGSYEQGRGGRKLNIVEANAVIDEVRAVLSDHPEDSVGVITFNASQAEFILERLEADASEQVRASLDRDDEPLFVKNLENVQGDERDHIVFSLTYSLGADGRLPANFGLLSRRGGERRLNVALTRARMRNVLFASFDPNDIADSGETSRGPEHLREYMRAARSGDLLVESVGEIAPDSYREAVAHRLREAGAEVVESVGLSSFRVDVAARLPGGRWVAVQLDSPSWAGRAAVVDRDELPEAVLVGAMGWAAVTQVYRAEWVSGPDAVVAGVLELSAGVSSQVASQTPGDEVSGAGAAEAETPTPTELPRSLGEILAALSTDGEKVVLPPDVAQAVAVQAASVRRLAESVSAGGTTGEGPRGGAGDAPVQDTPEHTRPSEAPSLSPFVSASVTQVGDRSVIQALPSEPAVAQVAAQWRDVVAAEGPVSVERALRIVAQRFGWRHLMPHRRGAVLDCLPADLASTRVPWQAETHLWPPGVAPQTYREVRGGSRTSRKIAEIAPQERANAIRLVLAESGGACTEGELARGVNEVFGFGRFGGMSRGQLRDDLGALVEAGEMRTEAGQVESTAATAHPAR